MERAVEGDDVLPLGVIAGELERGLDGLGTGVAVVDAMRAGHGSDLRQPLGEHRHLFVVEVGARHVDQLRGLLLDGGDDLGVAVPGRRHRDPGGEVEELVAVDVFDDDTPAALGDHRIRAGVRRRNILFIGRENALRVGAGQRGLNLGTGD